MEISLLSAPLTFVVMLAGSWGLYRALSVFSFRRANAPAALTKAYACGEDSPAEMGQPDYGQFFPFAFFFTILHVVALTVATVPVETVESFATAALYVVVAVVAMSILFKRQA